jgi:hypothetical protein
VSGEDASIRIVSLDMCGPPSSPRPKYLCDHVGLIARIGLPAHLETGPQGS